MIHRLQDILPSTIVRILHHSLAWNGEEYGLSWKEGYPEDEIYFIRIDEEGNKISPDIPITNDPASSDFPFLVWNGIDYGDMAR